MFVVVVHVGHLFFRKSARALATLSHVCVCAFFTQFPPGRKTYNLSLVRERILPVCNSMIIVWCGANIMRLSSLNACGIGVAAFPPTEKGRFMMRARTTGINIHFSYVRNAHTKTKKIYIFFFFIVIVSGVFNAFEWSACDYDDDADNKLEESIALRVYEWFGITNKVKTFLKIQINKLNYRNGSSPSTTEIRIPLICNPIYTLTSICALYTHKIELVLWSVNRASRIETYKI